MNEKDFYNSFKKMKIPKYTFDVGQIVLMTKQHPWQGCKGKIVRMEQINTIKQTRPVVELDNGTECFIMADGDAKIIG